MRAEPLSVTLEAIKRLVAAEDVLISEHGYDELGNDAIAVREVLNGIAEAVVVEDYPDYYKGSSVLVLQSDADGQPIHVVWGIPAGQTNPAVLVTAYRPEPRRWSADFLKRLK